MQIKYRLNNDLPPLVWIAKCLNGEVDVLHGNKVECRENFFVEGAWNGEFEKGDFVEADWFCGTGGRVSERKVTFSTPTHVIGGLYLAKIGGGGGYYIANSLYLLMATMDYKYDPQYLNYEVDFNTVLFGVHKYKKEVNIYDVQGNLGKVEILYFRNIKIDEHNQLRITVKLPVKAFAGFEDYRNRLSTAIKQMTANAKDSKRDFQYGMVTTISKGYDAPCCAVIAKEAGCDTAVTFKPEGKYAEDCGTEIAKALGYTNIIERDAMAFKERTDNVEALYVASGELGSDISFCAFDEDFKDNLVFTGDRGDSVWGRNATNRNDVFAFNDMLSHLGIIERRLWLGYIAVPMPLYGASAWTSLFDIANSNEMKAWQLDNNYDRPIPRRIVETAGVPREAFGVKKHGAGFIYRYDWLGRIVSRMSDTAGSSFKAFVRKNKKPHLIQIIQYIWETRHMYFRKFGMKIKLKQPIEYSRVSNAMGARYLIPWAGEVVLDWYDKILRNENGYEYFAFKRGDTK